MWLFYGTAPALGAGYASSGQRLLTDPPGGGAVARQKPT